MLFQIIIFVILNLFNKKVHNFILLNCLKLELN